MKYSTILSQQNALLAVFMVWIVISELSFHLIPGLKQVIRNICLTSIIWWYHLSLSTTAHVPLRKTNRGSNLHNYCQMRHLSPISCSKSRNFGIRKARQDLWLTFSEELHEIRLEMWYLNSVMNNNVCLVKGFKNPTMIAFPFLLELFLW